MTMNRLTKNIDEDDYSHIQAGRLDFFLPFPSHIDQVSVSDSNASINVPTGAKFVIFSHTGEIPIAVKANSAAVFPVAGKTDGSGSLINPTQFGVEGLTNLNFIAEAGNTSIVSLAFYT